MLISATEMGRGSEIVIMWDCKTSQMQFTRYLGCVVRTARGLNKSPALDCVSDCKIGGDQASGRSTSKWGAVVDLVGHKFCTLFQRLDGYIVLNAMLLYSEANATPLSEAHYHCTQQYSLRDVWI